MGVNVLCKTKSDILFPQRSKEDREHMFRNLLELIFQVNSPITNVYVYTLQTEYFEFTDNDPRPKDSGFFT